MRTNAQTITGIVAIVLIALFTFLFLLIGADPVAAEAIPPSQVLLHRNSILAAQQSNEIHLPLLAIEKNVVNANNQTAASSRKIICENYSEYCTEEFLNPHGADVDIYSFQ